MKISVKVIPGAKKVEVAKESEPNCFKVKVNQVAEDGRANKAVIEALAEYFKVKKNAVEIVGGLTSRNKIVEIDF